MIETPTLAKIAEASGLSYWAPADRFVKGTFSDPEEPHKRTTRNFPCRSFFHVLTCSIYSGLKGGTHTEELQERNARLVRENLRLRRKVDTLNNCLSIVVLAVLALAMAYFK